jgi:hypothetical protein
MNGCNQQRNFERKWNFPNCLGAVDIKHVKIIPPEMSQSLYVSKVWC